MNDMTTTGVDYNTQREPIVLHEYGRCLQQMVDYARTLPDREGRQQCAEAIVSLMRDFTDLSGTAADIQQKLWNHLAAMAHYDLDIDYPVDIERLDERPALTEHVPYPGTDIRRRHYGALVETLAQRLSDMEEGPERAELVTLLANQMKRDLGRWNRDAMSEERVVDDLADYTDGHVSLLPGDVRFKSDGEILNDVQQMTPSRKKRRQR